MRALLQSRHAIYGSLIYIYAQGSNYTNSTCVCFCKALEYMVDVLPILVYGFLYRDLQ